MSLFIPKRLLVKPQSKHSKITQEIIARTRQYDPNVAIEYLNTPDFEYPVSSPRDKFLYMKDSAIISERSEDFIRTFDSPGNIVESLITVLNLSWMCANRCEYCYLQTNQTPEHYFYTNLNKAEHEIASSPAAHAAILTLWTHLSNYFGYRLIKLPDRFKETADWIREQLVSAHVSRDEDAIDRYYLMQNKLVEYINDNNGTYQLDIKAFRRDRATIKQWYTENLRFPLSLTASEFNDFLAVDHLTDNSAFLMRMLEKYPRFKFTIRSKSSYVDGFLRFNGLERARFNISLNTEHVIQEFEHGTATLDERIHAARKIQEAKGFPLTLVVEPMITYENHLEDYRKLIQRALTELDPNHIDMFILGSVRYADQLKAMVRLHFPETKLFDGDQQLVRPTKPDTKDRYDPEVRTALYSSLIAEIQSKSSIPVALGSETPDLWEALGMNQDKELGNKVYEPGDGTVKPPPPTTDGPEKKEAVKKTSPARKAAEDEVYREDEEDEIDPDTFPYWVSFAPQDFSMIEGILGERDDSIPLDRLKTTVDQLHSMATIRDVRSNETGEILGYDVSDVWGVYDGRPLNELQTTGVYFVPVKIIGRISQVSTPAPHEVSDMGTRGFVSLEIADTHETKIRTIDILVDCITVDLVKLYEDRSRCTFFGAIVPLYKKSGKGEFRFYLHDMMTEARPIDMVAWTPTEENEKGFGVLMDGVRYGIPKDHPLTILRSHKETNGVIKYIKEELARGLGIQGIEEAPHLGRALEFVIIQAFSQGRREFLEKLHALIIGPPNVGKAYLTKAAIALNTVAQEISSSSAKFTEAGLVGTVKEGAKKTISEAGILPLNHGGVVCIQEFHDVRGRRRDSICGIFVRMMEEGQIIESTTAATVHPAETALLLDMNRYSQINPSGHYDSFTDINIPINMLARFDYIVEIPRDEKRSKEIAEQMAGAFKVMGESKPTETEVWELRLKYLVAFLKTEYRVVSFPEEVRDQLQSRTTAMLAKIPPELQGLVEDMRLRIVRSAFKITKAVTVANASTVATREYAEYALRFVQDKVNYIRSIKPEDIAVGVFEERPNVDDPEKRQEIIENEFQGKEFGITEVMQFVKDRMEGECDRRTIQRDLGELGAKLLKKSKGLWSLP